MNSSLESPQSEREILVRNIMSWFTWTERIIEKSEDIINPVIVGDRQEMISFWHQNQLCECPNREKEGSDTVAFNERDSWGADVLQIFINGRAMNTL